MSGAIVRILEAANRPQPKVLSVNICVGSPARLVFFPPSSQFVYVAELLPIIHNSWNFFI